ncbi:LuxR family transcriptional regulator [Mycolicibacterium sp.]|uniref:helix-turn-helix transcriptional regulator n=1 Tax=Mycolicibacterium sp. TaxID=2320850 RepID=UPI001A2B7CD7|nr:LuxR family transcriptional regulator [Mycolicibacterium sp.]MBJ7340229.1 AAA family ATPase [Mycolicibacterium sp.]
MGAQVWPVVQRDSEFARIHAALAGESTTSGIVLVGDAGVGKTTLARLVTQALPTKVQWVAGTESARSIPLGVFAHLVSSATSRDPMAFLSAARQALLSKQGAVVGVDDAHMLDQLSATLLHQLALDGSVRIVATVRRGETVPDAITSLWKDGYLELLDLQPFTKQQCITLIEAALGGRVEGLSADLMWDASGGNALYVRHLVEGALEVGTLKQVRGVWQLRGRTSVTSELASLLDARIESLPDSVMHVLRLVTFCEPLDLDVLTSMAGAEPVELAEARGLIRISEELDTIGVRFTHPLFGEAIRRRLGVAAARRAKGELVRALRKQPITAPAQRIRLAELTLESDVVPEVDLLIGAARDAIALTNVTLGERLSRAAVNRGAGLVASELLGRAMLWQGNAAEAEEVFTAFDPEQLDELDLVRWGTARVANLHWAMGDADAADDIIALLRDRITDPILSLVVDGLAAASVVFENRLQEAAELAASVLANPAAPPSAIQWAVFGGGLALGLMGRGDEVATVAARGRSLRDQADGLLRYLMAFGEIRALVVTGDFALAEQRSADIVRVSSPGQYLAWGMANVLAGTVELARGQFPATVSRMEQTVAALTSESAASWSFPARLLLAQAYSVLGRSEPGAKMIAELKTRYGRHVAVFRPQLMIAESWLAAAHGNVSGAADLALEAARAARLSGQRAIELIAHHDAARFGDRTALDAFSDVAATIDGPLARIQHSYANALIDRDPAALYDCAKSFSDLGALLYAADAAAQAAVIFDSKGQRALHLESAAIADRLATACGEIRTPALSLAAQPLPLSTREREIANLAAQGLTNRDIAERLTVSARTVEGHIYRACMKLDVSDRAALASLMRRN